MADETKQPGEPDLSRLLSGSLNLLGVKLDLGNLLGKPEALREQLEALRERLKAAGGKEVLSDVDWQSGGASVSGQIRTGGVLGAQEFHIGQAGRSVRPRGAPGGPPPTRAGAPPRRAAQAPSNEPIEPIEPPVDIFHESEEIVVVADVPGTSLEDLDLEIDDTSLTIKTKADARRPYQKRIPFDDPVDRASMQATCNNGVLEIRVRRSAA